MVRRAFLLMFIFFPGNILAQPEVTMKKDLSPDWQVFDTRSMVPMNEEGRLSSIHFQLLTNHYPTDYLLIKSARQFFIFINGRLAKSFTGQLMMKLDSLGSSYGNTLNVTIYQNRINTRDLRTAIVDLSVRPHELILAESVPSSYFRDFVVVAGLAMIIFFVSMMRLHPKLSVDYFSFTRILSLRETEDNQSHARFSISSNVLFYIFCSLMFGFCLLILFHHLPDKYPVTVDFKATSFGGTLAQWLKLSFIIQVLLFTKIFLVYVLSNLFGIKGIAGIHFFNWIRLLLIVSCALSAIAFIYFISRGENERIYMTLLSTIVAVLIAWIVIVFLKLNNRTEHSMFHLFSYICATEVIPLLLTIKVLFN